MDQIRFLNLEYFFNWIYELFTGIGAPEAGGFFFSIQQLIMVIVRVILPLAILILIVIAIYYKWKGDDLVQLEQNRAYERIARTREIQSQNTQNTRWDQVVELFASAAPSDWRVAIIEADSMLDSLVTSLGYVGDTLGEKMKGIDKGNFPTLDEAWEAHKVRNRIAHDGVDFQLSETDKNQVWKMYEKVFTDAGYI